MRYTQNLDGCFESAIGSYGLPGSRLEHWLELIAPGFQALKAKAITGEFPHFSIAGETADLAEAEAALAKLCAGARTLMVLGTGGSSLGGQALVELAGKTGQDRLQVKFCDNIDARAFAEDLSLIDLPLTRFLVISKSGGTAETLAQMLTVIARLESAGLKADIGRMFAGVSDPRTGKANGLRDVCEHFGIPVLDHPPGIGGRFSALSIVGLLPVLACGLDPHAVRAGAQSVVDALKAAREPGEFAPALGAAAGIGLARDKNITTTVMFPYAARLQRFAAWHVQLWAESLGKNGQGTTPMAALGPVDQHSQLQLFLDGPHQHTFTVLRVREEGNLPAIPADLAQLSGALYLAGTTIADLVAAQSAAIADVFREAKRPLRIIDLPRLDEGAMGALMMHFMIETILAASLLDVDPFDQPAVELGKRITREYLARQKEPRT
jgi:glucose-6-phosphate isomerase